jgi:hypothetical protein
MGQAIEGVDGKKRPDERGWQESSTHGSSLAFV